ncbi:2-C-methyl-D-erythritol 2,4-cyclodiphosphate synthase [Marinicella sp. W31]|uniref:2-C-methyl-D-erythritol 2,4-cyclodiphosphate synthase n=1 Tax=Marinicella sp. W31 TaxID=3023713 RepID=UPI0037570756
MSIRIGQGFDVHAFTDGDHIMLGGVRITHDRGFAAHSDGDVLIHSICDALLGACALGDIGLHFPPDDPQWKDCCSAIFLQHCYSLVKQNGFIIGNIDSTIIAEQPKIKPHTQNIRQSLAEILDIDVDNISVKATTTEKLGFTGRGEGMAAQAICLLTSKA